MRKKINSLSDLMKLLSTILVVSILCSCQSKEPISVLVVTGGHAYDTSNFVRMFSEMEGIEFDTEIQPSANQMYGTEKIGNYDVIVYYDLYLEITEAEKVDFLELLDEGVGIVFLHHCMASYQDWDEYINILGGRYDLDTSGYAHDLEVPIKIINPKHPITKGLGDFTLHDETYFNTVRLPGVDPLLSTDHDQSDAILGWTNKYSNSRIVYLQPGHDNNAYSNENYRQLVEQAIAWVSR